MSVNVALHTETAFSMYNTIFHEILYIEKIPQGCNKLVVAVSAPSYSGPC